jgi:hypothetical protein
VEVIDNLVKELQLIAGEPAAVEKFGKGTLSGLTVEPYKCANETRKPAVGLQRPERSLINAGLEEDALKLL